MAPHFGAWQSFCPLVCIPHQYHLSLFLLFFTLWNLCLSVNCNRCMTDSKRSKDSCFQEERQTDASERITKKRFTVHTGGQKRQKCRLNPKVVKVDAKCSSLTKSTVSYLSGKTAKISAHQPCWQPRLKLPQKTQQQQWKEKNQHSTNGLIWECRRAVARWASNWIITERHFPSRTPPTLSPTPLLHNKVSQSVNPWTSQWR